MGEKKTFDELLQDEEIEKAYQACLKKIALKDRTIKEIHDYLNEKTALSLAQIDRLIEHLISRNYLNDAVYAASVVLSRTDQLQGKLRIVKALKDKGIAEPLIEKAVSRITEADELESALRYAEKISASIKETSIRMKQQKLQTKLHQHGYDFHIIQTVIGKLNFSVDENNQLDICRKMAAKVYKKYSLKYSGYDLRQRCFNALAQKGFDYDDINLVLNEMEKNHEQN